MRTRWLVLVAVLALAAASCGDDDVTATTVTAASTTVAPTTAAPTTTAAVPTIKTDKGVTEEPCPDSKNLDRGCIYLGVITDESGPFKAAAPALYAANKTFWARVNAAGGIGGAYDVTIQDDQKVDAAYTPAKHVEVYAQIADDVLALAQSLGTTQTLAALPEMKADVMVAAPATWWSGWAFDDQDGGLVLESGANYCVEAMNSVDFAMGAVKPKTVGVVYIPNDYGKDYAAGVVAAAEGHGLEVVLNAPTIPVAAGGDAAQTDAVTAILSKSPDVTFIVVGPSETGAIVGGAAAKGHKKPIIGAGPSWNPALLASAAGPAFEAGIYFNSAPWGPWAYESDGHAALRTAAEAVGVPPTNFFVAGWVLQYPLKAALEQAFENGDLTRTGLKEAAASLVSVDYEGTLPAGAGNYAGGPAKLLRQTLISKIDKTAPDGLVVVQDFFAGPSVSAAAFDAPCAGAA